MSAIDAEKARYEGGSGVQSNPSRSPSRSVKSIGRDVRPLLMPAPILRYSTTVAELGTIRQAAKRLQVSESAINHQILNLAERITLVRRVERAQLHRIHQSFT